MERNRRILILKVILKSMLLFAALWLLWVLLGSIPGGPKPTAHRKYGGVYPVECSADFVLRCPTADTAE
jgi:hypothetical protein